VSKREGGEREREIDASAIIVYTTEEESVHICVGVCLCVYVCI
jgi:hypothetical protein